MSSPFFSHVLPQSLRHLLQQTSVLALSWWQRLLLVVPVCLVLWWGVLWALGGD